MKNETMTIDEGTLIAYVDGELDSETARYIEQRLESDSVAKQFVERHREIAALARIAFNDTMHEEVPTHLKDAVTSPSDEHDVGVVGATNIIAIPKRSTAKWGHYALPMAAAVAGLLIGAGGGYELSGKKHEQNLRLAALTVEQDNIAMENTLNQALEVNLNDAPMAWSNPMSGQTASFTPVNTYQDKTGRFCREYRKDLVVNGKTSSTFGLACRNDAGKWETRYLIFENGAKSL
ncbi:MAG: RT0821/Lpp0805 family surface protein [Rhodospirillaceae bacterium]|nr:RT0821/Lpp0805 family surface protein [Rhodospirillaceae bacterium]